MALKNIRYNFTPIEQCIMCGESVATHKVLGKRMNQSQGKNPKNKVGITTSVLQCSKCHLIYSNPLPVPFDIQDHYGVPPESYWKESYFVIDEKYCQKEMDHLKQLMDIKPGMKALDVGAGLGKGMLAMQRIGLDAYGFEPSEQFYERAIHKMGIAPEKLKIGMIETVDYPENEFDFIMFSAVLEHIYDPAAAIMKAMKWLKPNGIIFIDVPSAHWLTSKILNFYYRITFSDYVCNISPMHDPFHLYEFSIKSFEAHAQKNNYEIISYSYEVCSTYLPKSLDFIIKPIMSKTDTGMQLDVWLRKKK
ncbi:MAG: class I SAM-dependent methyltransferase [Chitinophagales bacterium]